MAIASALGHWVALAALLAVSAAFGYRVLRLLRAEFSSPLEKALCAAGLGFGGLAGLLYAAGMLGLLTRPAVGLILVGMALGAWSGWRDLRDLGELGRGAAEILRGPPAAGLLGLLIAGCLLLTAMVAMAPLTGSDAMSYHFTAPRLWVEQHQFAPLLWLPHPLFSGQPHTFIALGMLLGSDRLAMGLIYLGGVLTVLAVFAFARRIVSSEWSLAAALAFLLAPMTYWQVSVSGAPDIWIAFYAILSLLALSNAGPAAPSRWFLLAAVFGGLAASGKYPAWAIPAILAVLILFWTRSLRASLLFAGVAVLVGIPPQFRNWLWTGDPFFPFLLRWFPPQDFNAHFVECIVNDSKSPFFELSIGRLLAFPFLLVVQGERYGVGHYFGPLGLLFAPSMLLLWGKGQAARLGLLFSAAFFLLNALTSQMARFLLPAFPVVMALALAGMAEVVRRRWRWAAAGCWGSLGLFFLFGAGSLGLYAKQFLPVALGLEREDVFLRRMAADYQVTEFVNLTLESDPGKVMVFYRHPYYLRVPFVYAEPLSSWGMNPRLYDTPEKLRQLLYRMDIRYVVRAPWYPPAIRNSFERLEQDGTLRLVNHTSVENFSNWRVTGRRTSLVVAVFRVEGNHVR